MKILITGATGFFGSALASQLQNFECEFFLLTRSKSNLERIKKFNLERQVVCCNTDDEVKDFIKKIQPDVVIHNACSYGHLEGGVTELVGVNIKLGILIIQTLISIAKPVTFINTATVLSSNVSLYALSKNQFSQWGLELSRRSAKILQFINVKLQHMYGPGDSLSKFSTYVLYACYQNEPTLELTLGKQKRDFIYVDDVVSAYLILITKRGEFSFFEDVDIGSGVSPSIEFFVKTVHKLTNSKTSLMFGAVKYRDNEPMFCQANLDKMRGLGWHPKFHLKQGILKTIELEFKYV
jgi:CDP-paratose synthetase